MTYRSKVDAWIAALLVIAGGGTVAAAVALIVRSHHVRDGAVPLGVLAVIGLLSFPLHYQLTDTELIVRSGVTRWRIPFASIVRVQSSSAMWSSPALSADRLEVSYTKNGKLKRVLISPKEKEYFLRDLQMRIPALLPAADGLGRAGTYLGL